MHVALHGNYSAPVRVTERVEVSKDAASFLVCTQKNFFLVGGCGFFVSDIISGGLLGHLGPLYLANQRLKRLGLEPSFQLENFSKILWPGDWALGQET